MAVELVKMLFGVVRLPIRLLVKVVVATIPLT